MLLSLVEVDLQKFLEMIFFAKIKIILMMKQNVAFAEQPKRQA